MGLDSVELLLAIEEEFGVDIPNSDAEKMITVGDVYEWLKIHAGNIDPANSQEQIWRRLVEVFVRQALVSPEQVKPDARIVRDLGID